MDLHLTFDDCLLLPGYSEIKRQDIDISGYFTPLIKLAVPFVSSPMDTVTEDEMAISMKKCGALGVIHRNLDIDAQARICSRVAGECGFAVCAVGIGQDLEKRAKALIANGAKALLIDSAQGYSRWVVEAVGYLKNLKGVEVIAGNVATEEAAEKLIKAGAKSLRVGMGPGSICTTRIVAGVGMPQLSAIMETAKACRKYSVPLIADGGVRNSGDIVKALAAGANTVMAGSIFARADEACSKKTKVKGREYKLYRGMGSVNAMKDGSAARYGQEYRKGREKSLTAEGVEGLVEASGKVTDILAGLVGGLRSGMYYVGAKDIRDLWKKAKFIRITNAGVTESKPHDILLEKDDNSN